MPSVRCSCCGGSDRVELTGVYAETLALLRGQAAERCAPELAAKAGCHPTAMNNRLAALERLGLATSRRWGRRRLYRAAQAEKE